MAVQLGHEGLAEAHDLGVAAAARIEVGAALAAADRHAGEGVFEDLLKAEEFHDAEVHRGVEPQSALVGPQRRVELHAEAAVDLHPAVIVRPRDPEDDLPLGLAEPLQDGAFEELRVAVVDRAEAFENLGDGLVEFRFAGVSGQDCIPDSLQPSMHDDSLRGTERGKSPATRRRHPILSFNLSDCDCAGRAWPTASANLRIVTFNFHEMKIAIPVRGSAGILMPYICLLLSGAALLINGLAALGHLPRRDAAVFSLVIGGTQLVLGVTYGSCSPGVAGDGPRLLSGPPACSCSA